MISLIRLLIAVIFLSFTGLHAKESDAISYNIQKKEYTLSTVFELTTPSKLMGTVVKSSLRVRTHYDLYDAKGTHKATAICRVLTLGLIYDWGTEMDVYDTAGQPLGMIDGQVVTGTPAKFSFYDATGHPVGIGYLDKNCTGFTIVNPNDEYHMIAQYTRRFIENTIDSWDVAIYDEEQIPLELLSVFGAFAVDRQNAFKPDT